MAKVTAETTSSRITAANVRRRMYEITGAGASARGWRNPRAPMPSPAFRGYFFVVPMLR
ncbi:hypothetical protein GCM10023336_17940 [Streptomyces similanensis]|uniref:Uncharacterized protein n=1 Tax=Streptomyces similanensis TaxID=1274988 RepID=A0ABP9K704_9ACTN